MALVVSKVGSASASNKIASSLPAYLYGLYGDVLKAVPPPAGMPGLSKVLASMAFAVEGFKERLTKPSEAFLKTSEGIQAIADICKKCGIPIYPHDVRGMSRHCSWQLFMSDIDSEMLNEFVVVAGAALVMAIHQPHGRFGINLAKLLLDAIANKTAEEQLAVLKRKSTKIITQAIQIYEMGTKINLSEVSFQERLADRFRTNLLYARNREHQAIADHRASSTPQILRSARALRKKIEDGDALSIFTVIAAISNKQFARDACCRSAITAPCLR